MADTGLIIDEVRRFFANHPDYHTFTFVGDGEPTFYSQDGSLTHRLDLDVPIWWTWQVPIHRDDILKTKLKQHVISRNFRFFNDVFLDCSVHYVTSSPNNLVQCHSDPPKLERNGVWISRDSCSLPNSKMPSKWQPYWLVNRSEIVRAAGVSPWNMLDSSYVYIKNVGGSLFAFDKDMENAFPLFGFKSQYLPEVQVGEIVSRPGSQEVWFARAAEFTRILDRRYDYVTGGEDGVRVHMGLPIHSPVEGWTSKSYTAVNVNFGLGELPERLAIYKRPEGENYYEDII